MWQAHTEGVTVKDEPILVTTAPVSPAEERRARERRYLITMAVRVVAFIAAIVLASGWVRVVAIALALVLPWIAVVLANAGPKKPDRQQPSLYAGGRRAELEGPDRD
jgi:Flp pilus assembly protein TadB